MKRVLMFGFLVLGTLLAGIAIGCGDGDSETTTQEPNEYFIYRYIDETNPRAGNGAVTVYWENFTQATDYGQIEGLYVSMFIARLPRDYGAITSGAYVPCDIPKLNIMFEVLCDPAVNLVGAPVFQEVKLYLPGSIFQLIGFLGEREGNFYEILPTEDFPEEVAYWEECLRTNYGKYLKNCNR